MRALALTAHVMNLWESCNRKFFFSVILRRGFSKKSESIQRGIFVHRLLARYYGNKFVGMALDENVQDVIDFGRRFVIDTDLPIELSEFIFQHFREYALHETTIEPWEIAVFPDGSPGIEAPFSRILYEGDGLRILHEGRYDLVIVKVPYGFTPVDHKSVEKTISNPTPLGHQTEGYSDSLGTQAFIRNEFGLQKTKTPAERFLRQWLPQLELVQVEWRRSAIRIGLEIDQALQGWLEIQNEKRPTLAAMEMDIFPPRRAECWRCIFSKVCSEQPDYREDLLKRDYEIVDPHDPFEDE